jgi:hypothetical protein
VLGLPSKGTPVAETTASKNERITDYIADITAVSLHSADPGTTGASEISGGSPAYARKTPAFSAASGGATNLSANLVFDVATGTTVAFYGLWKGATFFAGGAVTGGGTFTGQGTFTLTALPISA